ncbi:MAG: serine hydrolase domain-containing protein [Actinomycetota bacterium]
MSHRNVTALVAADDLLTETLQRLAERTVRGRRASGVLLGVESADGSTSVRVASGDASPDVPYFIASITKMFTSAVTLQLVDEGRLRLDDRVVPLLPDLDLARLHVHDGVDATDRLEVHHLLHHTSGLADYFGEGIEDQLAGGEDRAYSIQDTVDIARIAGAAFRPGDRDGRRSRYSDTNYQLLTGLIEAVTGQGYGEVVAERIIEPLDLLGTYVVPATTDHRTPLILRSGDQPLSIPQALASERGAGGIVSTLDDQLRFSRAFHDGELFAGGLDRAVPCWNRVQSFAIGYGHGVMRYRLPRWLTGRRVPEMFGHSGTTASFLFHVPDLGCHIAGSFNQFADAARPFRLLPRVAGAIAAHESEVTLARPHRVMPCVAGAIAAHGSEVTLARPLRA